MMLSHVINAQEFWTWQTKHWVDRVQAGFGVPFAGYERSQVPDRLVQQQGRDTGTLSDLRHEFDVHIDDGLTQHRDPRAHRGSGRAREVPRAVVTVRYMPLRWSAHLREHFVQIERTLDLIEFRMAEQARVAARFLVAYVELEGIVLTVRNPRNDAILQTTLQEKVELSSTLVCSGIISRVDTTHAQEEA
jgi:hypothetical protein